ncbi:MAG: hypothetical protein FJ224_00475 [Lentisphaerae bacterium]|nr:hypothetical protein [Lentisphaerota bacterium]
MSDTTGHGAAVSSPAGRDAACDAAVFRTCQGCGFSWKTRRDFVLDPAIHIVGYQANFVNLDAGCFLFNHMTGRCGTTLALNVAAFSDLYAGPVFLERATRTAACAGHCLHSDNMEPCPARCECAYVREILQMIRRRSKVNW